MKAWQFLLIFTFLDLCLTQVIDECTTKFESILEGKCKLIDTKCGYNSEKQICRRECSSGSSTYCSAISPPNYHTHKCDFDSTSQTCIPVQKECSEFSSINTEEDCIKLKSPDGDGYRCDIISPGGSCLSYSNDCTSFNSDVSTCENHIPFDYTYKCKYREETIDGNLQKTCSKVKRNCGDSFYKMNKELCHQLIATATDKKCFYISGNCQENYDGCKGYAEISCNNNVYPLVQNENGDDYDHLKRCIWKTATGGTGECVSRNRKCYEYVDTEGEEICSQLEATDSNKKCVYDSSRTTNKCIEEYRSCQLYNDNESVKTREECERIIPLDDTKLCYFNEEQNQCQERDKFTNCEDYKGNDKNICESIISKETNSRCILEKDSICKERTFHCTDTDYKYQCLTFAKASEYNKKCVYNENNNPKCFEVYKTCEDYLEDSPTTCSSIHPYNGKKCYFESNRCRSKNATCSDALTEDECQLIAKTGVSDPDKKVCDYSSGSCQENYKYCSDYRGSESSICRGIKPYDESGNNIDIYSHCIMDNSVGCKRVPYECGDAGNNDEYKCNSISPYIKDNKIKYCAFYGGTCKEYYKNCEDVNPNECTSNIPENYSQPFCDILTVNGVKSCFKKTDCGNFNPAFYSSLCYSIDPKCSYSLENSRHYCTTNSEKTCTNIQFYIARDENEEVCKSYESSDPNKMCSLKENKLNCELVDREPNVTSTESTSQSSSSSFIKKTISLNNIILLYLLI